MKDQRVVERPTRERSGGPFLSDERLARRAARADERAFTAIFQRYNQEIYRFCLSLLGDAEDARDALQNTMVKALQALPGEQRTIKLRPWLYRVAHNQSIDMLRSRKITRPLDPEIADPADGLAETSARRERLRQLLGDLGELPERQRAALLMRELGGLEFDRIAEALDSSPAVARQTVYEARLSLRGLEAGREMSCEEAMHRLSNADGRVVRRRDLQAHLRACPDCRAFRDSIETRRRDLTAMAPLPVVASAGILHAILGGGAGSAGGAAAAGSGAVAVSAGKAVTAGFLTKSVATVAVVAAVGVSAADRSGLIDAHLPGGAGDAATKQSAVPAPGGTSTEGSAADAGQATGDEGGSPKHGDNRTDAAGKGNPARPGAARSAHPEKGAPASTSHGQAGEHGHGKPDGADPGHGKQAPGQSASRRASNRGHSGGRGKPRGGRSHGHGGAKPPPVHKQPSRSAKDPSESGESTPESGGAGSSAAKPSGTPESSP